MPRDGKLSADETQRVRCCLRFRCHLWRKTPLVATDTKGVFCMKKNKLRDLIVMGLLVAIEVILSRFLSVNAWNMKIGFNFIPVVVAAVLYGALPAGIVAAMGDFIGAILFPIGAYFPGFTFTAFLTGLVFGAFLHKSQKLERVLASVLINQLILGLWLNSFWISTLYGTEYLPLLLTRIPQCVVLCVVQTLGIRLIAPAVLRIRGK